MYLIHRPYDLNPPTTTLAGLGWLGWLGRRGWLKERHLVVVSPFFAHTFISQAAGTN
jgi:hypothetical protein